MDARLLSTENSCPSELVSIRILYVADFNVEYHHFTNDLI